MTCVVYCTAVADPGGVPLGPVHPPLCSLGTIFRRHDVCAPCSLGCCRTPPWSFELDLQASTAKFSQASETNPNGQGCIGSTYKLSNRRCRHHYSKNYFRLYMWAWYTIIERSRWYPALASVRTFNTVAVPAHHDKSPGSKDIACNRHRFYCNKVFLQ